MTRLEAIEVTHDDRVAVVRFREASLESGSERKDGLRDDLRRLLESKQTANVIVDLDGVTNCSSETFGALVELQKALTRRSCRLHLCGLSDHLLQKVRSLKLKNTVFRIYANVAEAIAAL